ncbi:hypothetical protein MPSEU_000311300 [Mayamaea pseudoterrestris]|nr:hypothetical protein MPSEU_000311300 [Mayamaea pseudoterrestris]
MTTTCNDEWSISIKQVNQSEQPSFTLKVSPNDEIHRLQKEIQSVTGLEPSRQRLIYRGRLVAASASPENDSATSSNETNCIFGEGESTEKSKTNSINAADIDKPAAALRIKDIVGLADGHTIHLMERKEQASKVDDATESTSIETSADTDAAPSTGDFLAALLNLGGGGGGGTSEGNNTSNTNNNDDATTNNTSPAAARLRSSRLRASRRRYQYRLEAGDLEQPDPGSMESVRQGLMTLHTLLPSTQAESPLQVNRRWYLGQWIDCLDTVNQWLEATVIDVVDPDSILPPRQDDIDAAADAPARSQFITSVPRNQDAFVAASDLERRTQLLLEPCEQGDVRDEGGQHAGWRRRDNHGVQLLLVHYNGWPHRWDEWIRSDSDRIRLFRTRTRHPNSSQHACPTPQSAYAESPSTHFRSDVEMEDREALLPELGRVMHQVNSLLNRINGRNNQALRNDVDGNDTSNLPWLERHHMNEHDNAEEEKQDESNVRTRTGGRADSGVSTRDLEVLAPLLDRLGRTLIDTAPHVMSLARANRESQDDEPPDLEPAEEVEGHPTSLGGLLSLLSRDSTSTENVTAAASDNTSAAHVESVETTGAASDEVSIDPDHTDFSSGVVNTSRGEVRSGPRSRSQSNNDDAASLFGAYLASASLGGSEGDGNGGLQGLGRILSDRTGGIDIHIHAVVTAPGMPTGVLGLAGLMNSGDATATSSGTEVTVTPEAAGGNFLSRGRNSGRGNRSASVRRRMSPIFQNDDEDDMGIFSDLYSETPEPVNLVSPSTSMEQEESVMEQEESEHPSPLPPRSSSRRTRSNSSRSLNSASRSDAGERSQGRFFNRFFRRSNNDS